MKKRNRSKRIMMIMRQLAAVVLSLCLLFGISLTTAIGSTNAVWAEPPETQAGMPADIPDDAATPADGTSAAPDDAAATTPDDASTTPPDDTDAITDDTDAITDDTDAITDDTDAITDDTDAITDDTNAALSDDTAAAAQGDGCISGFLWVDGNGSLPTDWNGLYDSGERPLAGYTVSLYAAGDKTTPIAQTTTDSSGRYIFAGLAPGSYIVGLSSDTVGGTEYLLPMSVTAQCKFAVDWGSTPMMAFTGTIEITADAAVEDINAGMRLPMGIVPAAGTTYTPLYGVTPPPGAGIVINNLFSYVGSTGNDTANPNVAVVANDQQSAYGAMWANQKINLTKPFSVDMYLFMAHTSGNNTFTDLADGMTFTLQNDPRGTSAVGSDGECLGAYGSLTYSNTASPGVTNRAVIRYAASIEFDLYYNAGGGSNFVNDPSAASNSALGHCALTFPQFDNNMSPSYLNMFTMLAGDPNPPTYPMGHQNVFTFSKQRAWVPFNVTWTPSGSGGTLKYTFNGITKSYAISSVSSTFGGSSVYWGFTGATGKSTSILAAAIEKISPNDTISVTKSVTNAAGTNIDGKTADEGSTLTYTIRTTASSAVSTTSPIVFSDALSNYLTYAGGNANVKVSKGGVITNSTVTPVINGPNMTITAVPAPASGQTTLSAGDYVEVSFNVKVSAGSAGQTVSNTASGVVNGSSTDSNTTQVTITKPIVFYKVDSDGKPLPNASFSLYTDPAMTADKLYGPAQSSGSDGKVSFSDVVPGTYYLAETTTPTGYITPSASSYILVVVSRDGTFTMTGSGDFAGKVSAGAPYTVQNDPQMTDLIFTKLGAGGAALSGAEFTLYQSDGITQVGTALSNSYGTATFTGLLQYGQNYILKETTTPAGYVPCSGSVTVSVSSAGVVTMTGNGDFAGKVSAGAPYTVQNDPQMTDLIFTKLGAGGAALSGAEFTLYQSDGTTQVGTAPSNSYGTVTFIGLLQYGQNYILKETTTPAGYVPYSGTIDVAVDVTAGSVTMTAPAGSDFTGKVSASAPYTVQNDLETTSLTISKAVAGPFADKTKDFNFTITLEDADHNPLTGTFDYTGDAINGPADGSLPLVNGKATFSLKHGQNIVIANVPQNGYVQIMEADDGNYDTSFTDNGGTNSDVNQDVKDTGLRPMSADRSFAFTNTRVEAVPAGITLNDTEAIEFGFAPIVLITIALIIGAVFLRRRKIRAAEQGR